MDWRERVQVRFLYLYSSVSFEVYVILFSFFFPPFYSCFPAYLIWLNSSSLLGVHELLILLWNIRDFIEWNIYLTTWVNVLSFPAHVLSHEINHFFSIIFRENRILEFSFAGTFSLISIFLQFFYFNIRNFFRQWGHFNLFFILILLLGQNILDPNTAELWVASRVFDRSQNVGDRLGKNEKTKVI